MKGICFALPKEYRKEKKEEEEEDSFRVFGERIVICNRFSRLDANLNFHSSDKNQI